MNELLISQLAPILTTAVVSILVIIIKKVGDAVIELLVSKKKEVELRIASSGHEAELNTAKEAWHAIEEKFRITENCTSVLDSKADEFDKLLRNRIPGLTQSNLDYLRQTVAGEVNKYKNIENSQSATATDSTSDSETINSNDITTISNVKLDDKSIATNDNAQPNNKNIASSPNLNTSNINASSNTKVDNPDNKQSVGARVNAISASVPN